MPTNLEAAVNCFKENRDNVDAQAHAERWNLYNGLSSLSVGVDQDLIEIKMLLKQILAELRKRP
jgi:hypothetical protein